MQLITDDELNKLPLRGKGTATLPNNKILNLKKGENLKIETKDWKRKDTPGRICRYLEKKFPNVKYDVFTIADKKGWVVKRIA